MFLKIKNYRISYQDVMSYYYEFKEDEEDSAIDFELFDDPDNKESLIKYPVLIINFFNGTTLQIKENDIESLDEDLTVLDHYLLKGEQE